MADASEVIRALGLQVGQLTIDKAVLTAELADAQRRIAELEAGGAAGEAAGD